MGKFKEKGNIILIYGFNFVANVFWSVFYFGLKEVRLAFWNILFLWASILCMIILASRINKKATWLLVPYLLWVSFASILNYLSAFP